MNPVITRRIAVSALFGAALAVLAAKLSGSVLLGLLAYSFCGSAIFLLVACVELAIEELRMRRLDAIIVTDVRPSTDVASGLALPDPSA